jgi:hypothetical protein
MYVSRSGKFLQIFANVHILSLKNRCRGAADSTFCNSWRIQYELLFQNRIGYLITPDNAAKEFPVSLCYHCGFKFIQYGLPGILG